MVDFGNILKTLRLREKLTQAQLAQKLGLTKSVISAYETGLRLPSCTVPLIFNQINMAIYAVSWYNKRNGGDLLWQDQRNIEFP